MYNNITYTHIPVYQRNDLYKSIIQCVTELEKAQQSILSEEQQNCNTTLWAHETPKLAGEVLYTGYQKQSESLQPHARLGFVKSNHYTLKEQGKTTHLFVSTTYSPSYLWRSLPLPQQKILSFIAADVLFYPAK